MRKLATMVMTSAILALGLGIGACSSDSNKTSGTGGGESTTAGTADGTGATAGDATGTDGTGDPGTTDGATGGTDTDGTTDATTGDTCTPFCQPNWECGPDGCGGICGNGCGAGFSCNNAKHECEEEAVVVPANAFGGLCSRNEDCQPSIQTAAGTQDNPQWPACLNAQCESGTCFEPACSKSCTITKDQTDWSGNAGPDGIDDPDASFNDCAGAEDGVMGANYTCVALLPPEQGQPLNLCLAGTTFKECKTNSDCPSDETCQLQFILGEYSTRCSAQPKNAVAIGDYCNRDPVAGDVAYCETTLCFGIGCSGFCDTDDDCLTDTCDGGTCAKSGNACTTDAECSSFFCNKGFPIFGSEGENAEITFDICFGKECETNANCQGDYYCAISGNGEQGEAVDWAHLCVAAAPGAASLGEECEDDPTDNIPKPECAGPCLNNGQCSAICNTDADCADGGPNQKCSGSATPVDFENDGIDDKHLPLGLCVNYEGTQSPCATDSDCGAEEVCDFYSFFTDASQTTLDATGICTTFEAGQADVGEACGGNSGVTCKSGFCLGTNGDQPGYCTAMCGGKDDCPQNTSLGLFQGTYNMACRGLVFSQGFIEDSNEDILWIPLCIPVVAETSPLTACNEDYSCAGAGEACQPFAIASGATGPASVELLCIGAGIFDDTGANFLPATAGLGESCDIDFESTNAADYCASNQCLPGADGGYCSALCDTDADCGDSMICDAVTLIDRVGEDEDLTINMCRKAESCIACSVDNDCTGDMVCVNAGGTGLLADNRCAPACSTDADCAGTDGGSTCAESTDADGNGTGVMACIPSCN